MSPLVRPATAVSPVEVVEAMCKSMDRERSKTRVGGAAMSVVRRIFAMSDVARNQLIVTGAGACQEMGKISRRISPDGRAEYPSSGRASLHLSAPALPRFLATWRHLRRFASRRSHL